MSGGTLRASARHGEGKGTWSHSKPYGKRLRDGGGLSLAEPWWAARVQWYAERVEKIEAIHRATGRRPDLFAAEPPPHCRPPAEGRRAA